LNQDLIDLDQLKSAREGEVSPPSQLDLSQDTLNIFVRIEGPGEFSARSHLIELVISQLRR